MGKRQPNQMLSNIIMSMIIVNMKIWTKATPKRICPSSHQKANVLRSHDNIFRGKIELRHPIMQLLSVVNCITTDGKVVVLVFDGSRKAQHDGHVGSEQEGAAVHHHLER